MIVDCFTIYDELDLLELRLQTLDAVVDRFVLCEAPFTFRGQPKPLAFARARERFERWGDRIVALVYPEPASENAWLNEWGQRDYLIAGLGDCAPEDLVLIGDVDEIPDPANVARRPEPGQIIGHRQRYSAGYLNRVVDEPWLGTRTIARGDIARYGSLSNVRKMPNDRIAQIDGGWHFTSLGGPAAQERKFRTASHAEVDLPYFRDMRRLEIDFAASLGGYLLPVDASFPLPVQRDPARWAPYLWTGPTFGDRELVRALEHAHGCFAYVPPDAGSVTARSAQPQAWETAGRERFGAAWNGEGDGTRWIVVDGLERFPSDTLTELAARYDGVVASAANARSFATFARLLGGGTFAPGHAYGLGEYRERIAAAGYTVERVDMLRNDDVFVAWPSMPEVMYGTQIGPLRIGEIRRDDLRVFLSNGFIFVLERPK